MIQSNRQRRETNTLRIINLILFLICITQSVHAEPIPAESFGKLPNVYDIAISPDGESLAYFMNINGAYGVRVLATKGDTEKPKILGLAKGLKPKWIKWVNNQRVLVGLWESRKSGSITFRVGAIYTVDAETMVGKYLVKPNGVARQFNDQVIDFLEHDPDHILMSYSDNNPSAPDIQKVNVTTGKDTRLKRGRKSIQNWYTDNRGEPRIGQGRSEKNIDKWTMIIRNANEDKWLDVSHYPGLEANSDIRGFTEKTNEVIVGMYNNKDTVGLYIYDLNQKNITRTLFHDDKYDAGGIITNSEGKVVGAKFVSDASQRVLFEGEGSLMKRLETQFPDSNVDYIDQSLGGKKVLFKLSNGSYPGAIFLHDKIQNKSFQLAKLRPDLITEKLGRVLSAKYDARDGQIIAGYMTVPMKITSNAQIKNLPFIVLPHGGPYARNSKRFDYFAQFFASRGYGVFQMNFRGSEGYGKAFEEAGRKNWKVMQDDVEDATKMLIENGYANPEKICIAGWSYGGYSALMGGINNPDLYQCLISIAGVTDLKDMVNDLKKYRFGKISAREFLLQGFDGTESLKVNSPVRRANEIKVPVFLAHGEFDQQVHYDQFLRMKKALKKYKVDATTMKFDDEDHYLSQQKNRIEMFVGLDAFLAKHLGPSALSP